jgi:hypothetical protein
MGLISKNDGRMRETVENLINGSEMKSRVLRGGALLGMGSFSVLSPAERTLAPMTAQGIKE